MSVPHTPAVTVHIMLVCLPSLFISHRGHCPCLHGEWLLLWALSLVALQLQLSVMRVILVCAAVIGSEGGRVVGTARGRVGVVKEGREVRGYCGWILTVPIPMSTGMVFTRVGCRWTQNYPWVTHDVHYSLVWMNNREGRKIMAQREIEPTT